MELKRRAEEAIADGTPSTRNVGFRCVAKESERFAHHRWWWRLYPAVLKLEAVKVSDTIVNGNKLEAWILCNPWKLLDSSG